jgi:hypothetical protein
MPGLSLAIAFCVTMAVMKLAVGSPGWQGASCTVSATWVL